MKQKQPPQDSTLTEALYQAMCEMEKDLLSNETRSLQIAHRTNVIIGAFVGLFLIFSAFLGYQALYLSGDVEHLTDSMTDMYDHFAKMSGDLNHMTKSVMRMGERVRTIPAMTAEMTRIVENVKVMRNNVHQMSADVVHMDKSFNDINLAVNDMAKRFLHLTHSVKEMRKNVYKMSKPMKNIPFF